MRVPTVYILTNVYNGTLYVGVTSNLVQRIWQHREKTADGFTKRYGLDRLVWYEIHQTMEAAIGREKQIKRWNRAWKIRLIEETNSAWRDLYEEVAQFG